MDKIIAESINNHKEALILLEDNLPVIKEICDIFENSLNRGGKIIFMGNGGSAADAQHLAAELVGRFKKDRKALPALALSVNTSILTAVGNDYGFEQIFSRQIESLALPEDVVVAISTSGNSPNILKGVETAKKKKIKTVGFSGKDGGKLAECVDTCLNISSYDTPRVQEIHILAGHLICEVIEKRLT
ncbi:MAG: SIS domain-containing protein [Candidatus Omnitrophica bacterium]|nr:SIS domain-containing protein [Candidatus Omnitrophota bacterium]MBD3268659.1 SIS domain-containing protein [Candidatus Omnitrophota bacterium]